MRSSQSKMRVKLRKRKRFLAALLSFWVVGCAAPQQRQSKLTGRNADKLAAANGDDAALWEAVLVETPVPSGGPPVRTAGHRDGVVVTESSAIAAQDADAGPAVEIGSGEDVLPLPKGMSYGGAANTSQPVGYFVELALRQHPSIRAARQRVSAEVNRIPQVRALPDPMFNNTFWPIHEQSLQTAAGRVGNQMSISQAVPWPDKLRTKAAIVNQEVQMAQAEVDRIEREITESVRLAYYEVWFASRAITIIDETSQLVDDLTKVAEARYRSGGTQQDVLRARLEADRLEDQLIGLTKQKQVAQADLAALVQQPVTLRIEPTEDLGLADVPRQLDDLIALAEQCNPELAGLVWEIQRDRQKQRLACLQQYPDLQVGMSWGLVNDDHKVLSPVANGHDQISVNVGTTLPIWHRKINAGVREAANRTTSTALRLDAQRDALHGKLRRLLAQADAFTEQRDIYENRIIPRSEDTLKLSIADYRGKRTDFYSLIETYRELLTFETQLARIEASLAGTVAQIERAVGCE
jgi:cobalt-zinc-cadmium efflux system outer membrane protein